MAASIPKTLRVFIGCPGDMAPERAALLELEDVLKLSKHPVEFLIWPDVPPSAGRPQGVIFDHFPVARWDIFVGLLWARFGTASGEKDEKTGRPFTGTEEEFVRAYEAWQRSSPHRPHIAVYRCTRPLPYQHDRKQYDAVCTFFDKLQADGEYPALCHEFKSTGAFKKRIHQDLLKIIGKVRAVEKESSAPAGKARPSAKRATDWAAAEERYRKHLIDSHRIVKFHTAEARQPVEVELQKVFINLKTRNRLETRWDYVPGHIRRILKRAGEHPRFPDDLVLQSHGVPIDPTTGAVDESLFDLKMGDESLPPRFETCSLSETLFKHEHLAIAGSPGSGKSTLLQYLVLTFASQQQEARLQLEEERLPVLIRLRQFHRWVEQKRHDKKIDELRPAHFHEFLEQQWQKETGAPELPRGFFDHQLRSKNALILFDGLDEVAEPAHRRMIAGRIAAGLDDWREARVILTSRPRAWESEGRTALGRRVGEARICDLDNGQIEEFVRHWYLAATLAARGDTPAARGHAESRTVDLIGAVKPDRIRKLAATPLMLSILAMVHSRGVGLPQERSQLYHECIEFMLGYWDEIAGLDYDSELQEVARHERQDKCKLMAPVALWMHRLGSEQIEPLHDDLVREFGKGFQLVFNEPKPAAERHARAFLRLIVERGGLMQESEAGQFRFVHLTFQEYLAASAIAHGEAPFAQVEPHLHDPWWREVILLAGGELSRQRSYRVKADTTVWLTGILNADTWAEKYLKRDLQLAAQSCADMSETGVDPKMTAEIATGIVKAIMEWHKTRAVTHLDDFVRALPPNHLGRAIVSILPHIPTHKSRLYAFPAFGIAELLPASLISAELKAEFIAGLSHDHSDVRNHAAFFLLLHGPVEDRLKHFGIWLESAGVPDVWFSGERAAKIIGLGDEKLTEALRGSWRAKLRSRGMLKASFAAAMLAEFGSKTDSETALAWLCDGPGGKHSAGLLERIDMLMELRNHADTPRVLRFLEDLKFHREQGTLSQSVLAFCVVVERRKQEVDWGWLTALLETEEADDVRYLIGLLSHWGDETARLKALAAWQAQWAKATPAEAWELADLSLQYGLDNDSEEMARGLAQATSFGGDDEDDKRMSTIAQLGQAAWKYPALIRLALDIAFSSKASASQLPKLASLASSRPADSPITIPPAPELAKKALERINQSASRDKKWTRFHVLESFSTFPELRTAWKGDTKRQSGARC